LFTLWSMLGRRRRAPRAGERGQSLVEFALVLPLLLIIVMAIVDFARLYTTMLTVESAAREAADYGAFHWYNWTPANATTTLAEMQRRACIASSNLPDYVDAGGGTCTNPGFTSAGALASPTNPTANCTVEPAAGVDPCRVTVSLTYDFHLFAPLSLDFFGVHFGLPSTLSFTRDSVFTISDFGIDPTP